MPFDPATMSKSILDLSSIQNVTDFHALAASGIEGVILRCIRSNGAVDPDYVDYAARAKECNLCVGAYCFLNSGDGANQAQSLLSNCGTGVVLALDWETSDVSLDIAEAFAQQCVDQAGRHPLAYGSRSFLEVQGIPATSILAACPLWLAEYGPDAHVPAPWKDWSIWQNTDNAYNPGVGTSDGDIFHQPPGNLANWWSQHAI